MPVEFLCQKCGKMLRVPDDAAGKLTRCPQCGNVSRAPEPPSGGSKPTDESPPAVPPATDPGPAAGATPSARNPFSDGVNPFRELPEPPGGPADNPYTSPTAGGPAFSTTPSPTAIRSRVQGPGIGLIVLGVLNLVMLGILSVLFVIALREEGLDDSAIGFAICGVFLLTKSLPVIYGGIQMRRLKSYPAAMTAAILVLLPCAFSCWVVELAIGIWALVVLSDFHVRQAFRQGATPATATGNPFRNEAARED